MGNRKSYNNGYYDNEDPYDFTEALKRQVNETLDEEKEHKREQMRKSSNQPSRTQTQSRPATKSKSSGKKRKKKRKKRKFLRFLATLILILTACAAFLVFTKPGRKILYSLAGNYISGYVSHTSATDDAVEVEEVPTIEEWNTGEIVGRQEDYVKNYLLIGVEEINNARNTDSMIIASINTNDNTIKLTSLMRDSYVEVPGWKKTKLNAAYAHGGIDLLRSTIEQNYQIHLDGYATVNFDSFEEIIDRLGGIEIQLGAEEAEYLNTTNYITEKSNRNVVEGINLLNGDQALGYCRVRKVATYDGVNNDQGRTLRQRRVLNAIFEKYKSSNILTMLPIMNDCISYVNTNLTTKQISTILEDIVENQITTMDMERIPIDGAYDSPQLYEGVTWPIVLDWDENIKYLYEFIYGDTEEEAAINLTEYQYLEH